MVTTARRVRRFALTFLPARRVAIAVQPRGLQLDLLTVILRLEEASYQLDRGTAAGQDVAEWLLQERVIKCDVPRLRGYLTAETIAWDDEAAWSDAEG